MSRFYKKNDKTYWQCKSHETQHKDKCCIHILENQITNIAVATLKKYSELTLQMLETADEIYKSEKMKNYMAEIDKEIWRYNNDLDKIGQKILALYEDFKNQLISKEEYNMIKSNYNVQHTELNELLLKAEEKKRNICNTDKFKKKLNKIAFKVFDIKNTEFVFSLIEEVKVFPENAIEVKFHFQNDFAELAAFVEHWR